MKSKSRPLHEMIVGSKETFALVIGPGAGPMREVQVWAGGRNLTPVDTSAYLPSFMHAMARDESLLCDEERIFEHEACLRGLTVEQAFERLTSEDLPHARLTLGVLKWGETMDDVLCFLVPVQDRIHLAWRELSSRSVHSVEVAPRELAETLRHARNILALSVRGAHA